MRFLFSIAVLALIPAFLTAEEPLKPGLRRLQRDPAVQPFAKETPQPPTVQQIVRNSAVIFSGTVLSVEHLGDAGAPTITRITFRVQNAIRGVRSGQVIQISEWGSLWNAGERYRRGENVVLFLYPKSKLGLTSPVGAAAGRFEVDKTGHVQIGSGQVPPSPIHRPAVNVRDFAAAVRRIAKD